MHQGGVPKLWNRGYARAALMGHEPTMNPTPAAAMLLGMTPLMPRQHRAGHASRSILKKRHPRTANPTAAQLVASAVPGGSLLTSLAGIASKLGIGSKYTKDSHVKRFSDAVTSGNALVAQSLIAQAADHAKAPIPDQAEWRQRFELMRAIAPPEYKKTMDKLLPPAGGTAAAGPSTAAQLLGVLSQPGTVRAIASAAKPRASRRARYPTYTDRYGRQRYSTRPPELGEMRLPAGATPSPGTPYSFFQGAVGKGGAAATAGQLAIAAAVGTAAYFGTQAILKHFAGANVAPEQAGVQLALAARDARKEYALTHNLRGQPPSYGVPAAVIKQIGEGMKAKLAELGYNAQGVRVRSASERFLSTYGSGE